MIIDTHVHYNLEPILDQWHKHWQTATQHQVSGGIVVGTTLESSRQAIEIAQAQPQLKAAIGLHPTEIVESNLEQDLAQLAKLATHPEVLAIGEIGLDYFRLDRANQNEFHHLVELQKKAFIAQLQLALKFDLTVSIHTRDRKLKPLPTHDNAYWDTLRVLQDHFLQTNYHPPFVLHCFSGPDNYVTQAISLGAFLGVDGNITYESAHQLRAQLATIPIEKILVETDAPYLAPVPHRSQTCEPWMVALTAQYLNDHFHLSLKQLHENTKQAFPKLTKQI